MQAPAAASPVVQGRLALDGWDQAPPRPPGPAAAPMLRVDGFEGPLDWLLDLARTRRIDLVRLSITALVEAFEAALTDALEADDKGALLLARWGEWLVMAAELTLLRSRLLEPSGTADGEAARGDAERLRQALLSRAETARVADWLDTRPQLGRDVHPARQGEAPEAPRRQRTGDITGLLRACLAALRLPAEAETLFRVPGPPFWSVAEARARLAAMLPAGGGEVRPLAGFLPPVAADAPGRDRLCRTAVSATFLASLELARNGTAVLVQEQPWQAIRLGWSGAADAGPA